LLISNSIANRDLKRAFSRPLTTAMLNMSLRAGRATKGEIRVLKAHGILGKRAPSCSLLAPEDMAE